MGFKSFAIFQNCITVFLARKIRLAMPNRVESTMLAYNHLPLVEIGKGATVARKLNRAAWVGCVFQLNRFSIISSHCELRSRWSPSNIKSAQVPSLHGH